MGFVTKCSLLKNGRTMIRQISSTFLSKVLLSIRRVLCYDGCMKRRTAKINDSNGRTPMDAALHFLGYRARSVREMERYLDEKQYGEYEIMQTVERLHELGLLDDEKFCRDFIESRLRTKPISRRHLREQLFAHEIATDIIEAALSMVTDEFEFQNAVSVADKYLVQFQDLERDERFERTLQRLLGRGFDYTVSRSAIETVAENML